MSIVPTRSEQSPSRPSLRDRPDHRGDPTASDPRPDPVVPPADPTETPVIPEPDPTHTPIVPEREPVPDGPPAPPIVEPTATALA